MKTIHCHCCHQPRPRYRNSMIYGGPVCYDCDRAIRQRVRERMIGQTPVAQKVVPQEGASFPMLHPKQQTALGRLFRRLFNRKAA